MLLRNIKGMVMVEWVVVMPIFIFFLLGIVQLGFMMNAKHAVTYAAFASARTLLAMNSNQSGIDRNKEGKKAAALACMGITGLANLTPYPPSTDPDIIHIASRYSHDVRSHADFLQRYSAALDKTHVKIWYLKERGDNLKVKVEVFHDYELDFPIVNYFISALFPSYQKYGYPHIPIRSAIILG